MTVILFQHLEMRDQEEEVFINLLTQDIINSKILARRVLIESGEEDAELETPNVAEQENIIRDVGSRGRKRRPRILLNESSEEDKKDNIMESEEEENINTTRRAGLRSRRSRNGSRLNNQYIRQAIHNTDNRNRRSVRIAEIEQETFLEEVKCFRCGYDCYTLIKNH